MQSPRPAMDILILVREAAVKYPDNKQIQELKKECEKEYADIEQSCGLGWY